MLYYYDYIITELFDINTQRRRAAFKSSGNKSNWGFGGAVSPCKLRSVYRIRLHKLIQTTTSLIINTIELANSSLTDDG